VCVCVCEREREREVARLIVTIRLAHVSTEVLSSVSVRLRPSPFSSASDSLAVPSALIGAGLGFLCPCAWLCRHPYARARARWAGAQALAKDEIEGADSDDSHKPLVIRADSRFGFVWNLIAVVSVWFNQFLIPYYLLRDADPRGNVETIEDHLSPVWYTVILYLGDAFSWVDMFLRYRFFAVRINGIEVTDRPRIQRFCIVSTSAWDEGYIRPRLIDLLLSLGMRFLGVTFFLSLACFPCRLVLLHLLLPVFVVGVRMGPCRAYVRRCFLWDLVSNAPLDVVALAISPAVRI
jgi:hypothetical protein